MKTRPEKPEGDGWKWYSYCSAHFQFNEECNMCNSGSWIDTNSAEEKFSRRLWKFSHFLWRWWANKRKS